MDPCLLLQIADKVGHLSKDPSTQVGCLLLDRARPSIIGVGWNSFPDGVDDTIPERWFRPGKYRFVTHAESNAIAKAAKNGIRLDGAMCVISLFPCTDCAKALIQAGVKKIVTRRPDVDHPKWGADWESATSLLREAGVELFFADGIT